SLDAWKVQKLGAGAPQGGGQQQGNAGYGSQPQQQQAPRANNNPGFQRQQAAPIQSDADNDLPF
ncbi:MAG TPA: hypothetical protein VEI97_18200, partial [bacterium]|nr:hypothetical protein [bacterium]